MFYLTVRRSFSAAHVLRGHTGKCSRPHGHNFAVEAVVRGRELDGIGMLVDFAVLKARLDTILEALDHRDLNQLEPFTRVNPSAENIARHLHGELGRDLPAGVAVDRVTVFETEGCSATYREDAEGADLPAKGARLL
jgi:6-pyruvoyltetrahydropterin/6-carboxytetrahydropterin synthase